MPAVAAAQVHGANLDLNIGPPADLQHLYFEGDVSVEPGHEMSTVYTNYAAHQSGFIKATPTFSMSFSAWVKREDGPFASKHPGTAVTRTMVPVLVERTSHGFPYATSDAGYFMIDEIKRTLAKGVHAKLDLKLNLILFDTTTANQN